MCLDLIRAYAGSNASRYRGTGLGLDEEESCEDLLQFLKMMTHLTIKDFIDFGSSGLPATDNDTATSRVYVCTIHARILYSISG